MPKPHPNSETRDEWMPRCIRKVMDDGSAENQDQAVAMCSQMWRDAKKENAMDDPKYQTLLNFQEWRDNWEKTYVDDIGRSQLFEAKAADNDQGEFSGIASVYGVEDLGGDVVVKGAFTKTISENPVIPILNHHKPDQVIGMGEVKEWQGKLMLKGKLDMEDPAAREIFRKMKTDLLGNGKKMIDGLSIGYKTIKSSFQEVEDRLVRHLQEVKLFEVSIVTFPMQLQARMKQQALQEFWQNGGRVSYKTLVGHVPKAIMEKYASALKDGQIVIDISEFSALVARLEALEAKLDKPPSPSPEPVDDHSGLHALLDDISKALN